MHAFSVALYRVAIALWAGGLWGVGYIAAPTLFAQLADRALAGQLAGHLFAAITWVGAGCAAYLTLFIALRRRWRVLRSSVFWLVAVMLALALAGHLGVQPVMAQLKAEAFPRAVMETVLRDRFAMWHGVSSGLYLIQSALAVLLVALQDRGLR